MSTENEEIISNLEKEVEGLRAQNETQSQTIKDLRRELEDEEDTKEGLENDISELENPSKWVAVSRMKEALSDEMTEAAITGNEVFIGEQSYKKIYIVIK